MKQLYFFLLLSCSLLFVNHITFAQKGTIAGKVVDQRTGEPLLFANVIIQGTTIGGQTDFEGDFSIRVDSGMYAIEIVYIGFKTKVVDSILVNANDPTVLGNVPMEEDVETLGSVVVLGQRIRDKEGKQSLTIESMSSSNIIGVTSSDYYNSLENVRGVDGTSASIGRKRLKKTVKTKKQKKAFKATSKDRKKDIKFNKSDYGKLIENQFQKAKKEPLSTFSIDVDAASYSNIRRSIEYNHLPNPNEVRIEEMINYFNYDYPAPQDEHPFAIHTELGDSPWNENNYLLHIGLQGETIEADQLPTSNLVFLIDVSGSMSFPNKLGLVKESLQLLVEKMPKKNTVALVVYAGRAGLVLPSTSFGEKEKILRAINNLRSGGSTAGGAGIQLAYKVAKENFIDEGNNRVILCTDGDFNVGVSSQEELKKLIEEKREDDIFLTVLGFGTGNYQDAKMEELSNHGNGNYGYIDNIKEAEKMLVEEMGATLHTIAKDVKLQIEFNPNIVKSYRLIGYENRMLKKEDFNDDTKDAGELGAGHTVTAIYEIEPVEEQLLTADTFAEPITVANVDPLKYQTKNLTTSALNGEWVTIKFRYKQPKADKSILLSRTVTGQDLYRVSNNFRFSAAVAYWGMLLRKSDFTTKEFELEAAISLAKSGKGLDARGYRAECIQLMEKTIPLLGN